MAKVLVNQLRVILPSLISKEQGAIMPGRSITNNILLAQEIMDSVVRALPSRSLMMIQLDMKKVYDRVHW